MARNVVFGTAGHIDHGKSTLIKALTSKDTDRLKEEKKRGITIDLGFAGLKHGKHLFSFVDVPGHEKLIKNMIAGATGFDAALFAVDCREGIRKQTVEHLNILETLGIKHAVIAVTKTDLLGSNELDNALRSIKSFFDKSSFQHISYVPVSIEKPETLTELLNALEKTALLIPEKNSGLPFLLRIDRSFHVKGFGTVVTGTVVNGTATKGASLLHLPSGENLKIRNIQVHDSEAETAEAGQRAALNLPDLRKTGRGDILTSEMRMEKCRGFYCRISVFNRLDGYISLKHNRSYPIFIGTDSLESRLLLENGEKLEKGCKAFAFVRLLEDYAPFIGEKFLIRGMSPQITVAGGEVLAIERVLPKRKEGYEAMRKLALEGVSAYFAEVLKQHPEGLKMPPNIQFFKEHSAPSDTFFTEHCVCLDNHYVISNESVTRFFSKLKEGEDPENLLKKYPNHVSFYIRSLVQLNISLAESTKDPFEADCEALYERMKTDPLLSNRTLVAECLKISEKEAEKRLLWLKNRDLIKEIEPRVYVADTLLASFVNSAENNCKTKGFTELADMRNSFPLPRKLLVPLLDYLEKTGLFIRKDKKHYLK
jgi:selenocysteine-specific elongation factor